MSDLPKVLIADDEQDCIDFVCDALADIPCEVISAMDGQQALDVAREQNPQVIILDIQMPERNGFEVFAELQADENLRSVPVIMLTAIAERTGMKFSQEDMGEYMGGEPKAYVDKPIEPIVLRQTVNRLLKEGQAEV